jgi:hypothetical protein
MDPVVVSAVNILNNMCPFATPFNIEIVFQCTQALQEGVFSFFFFFVRTLLLTWTIFLPASRVAPRSRSHDPDLEWKVIYVGSAESEKHDQELENFSVGPVSVGVNRFTFEVRVRACVRACVRYFLHWKRCLFSLAWREWALALHAPTHI